MKCGGAQQSIGSPTYCDVDTITAKISKIAVVYLYTNRSAKSSSHLDVGRNPLTTANNEDIIE